MEQIRLKYVPSGPNWETPAIVRQQCRTIHTARKKQHFEKMIWKHYMYSEIGLMEVSIYKGSSPFSEFHRFLLSQVESDTLCSKTPKSFREDIQRILRNLPNCLNP